MKIIDLFSIKAKNYWRYFYAANSEVMENLTDEEYIDIFIKGRSKQDIQVTYEKAWQAKNFEIELYWKRASYFWAFQIASFAGYFSVGGSKSYQDGNNPEILFFVVCIGFITSLAWSFTNNGSKTWQRHWEIHVDMLEDQITGPLYKIVTSPKTFSLSKINQIVSNFIVTIWIILGVKYFTEHLCLFDDCGNLNIQVSLSFLAVVYFAGAMRNGYGRGRFGERKVKFYKRKFTTK